MVVQSSSSENLEKFSAGLLAFAAAVVAFALDKLDKMEHLIGHPFLIAGLGFLAASVLLGFVARLYSVNIGLYLRTQNALTEEMDTLAKGDLEEAGARLLSRETSTSIAKGFALVRRNLPLLHRRRARHFEKKWAADPLWLDYRQRRDFFRQAALVKWQAILVSLSMGLILAGWLNADHQTKAGPAAIGGSRQGLANPSPQAAAPGTCEK